MTALAAPRSRSRWVAVLRTPKVVVGVAVLAVFVAAAFANPVLLDTVWAGQHEVYDPMVGHDRAISHPSGPSAAHWLGTDSFGRDVLSMFTLAAQPTLMVALTAGMAVASLSLPLGALAAYRRGWVDGLVTNVSDAMLLLPALLAVFVLGVGRSPEFGAVDVGLTFGVFYALGPATATVRTAALTVMARPFIDAARVAGGNAPWLLVRHVFPHLVPHVGVQAMVGVTGAVIADAFLQYTSAVGDSVGFGMMAYWGIITVMEGIAGTPWWVLVVGAGGITLLAAAFFLIGLGLREAYDPKSLPVM